MKKAIIVGTRESRLALAQTGWVIDIMQKHFPDYEFQIHKIKTEGDRLVNVSLDQIGGKGVFVKELESALLNGEVDMAVHSMKDMPALMPHGLKIAAVPVREDARDVLLSLKAESLEQLPEGAIVGTSSLRRGVQIKQMRPDVSIKPIRGNVDTRIRKMEEGQFDAIILAAAGLNRLGLQKHIVQYLPLEKCIPAVGQGALGLQTRVGDEIGEMLLKMEDINTRIAVETERAFLRTLNGNCKIPIAAHARLKKDEVVLSGLLCHGEDSVKVAVGTKTTNIGSHEDAGKLLAGELIKELGITFAEWSANLGLKG